MVSTVWRDERYDARQEIRVQRVDRIAPSRVIRIEPPNTNVLHVGSRGGRIVYITNQWNNDLEVAVLRPGVRGVRALRIDSRTGHRTVAGSSIHRVGVMRMATLGPHSASLTPTARTIGYSRLGDGSQICIRRGRRTAVESRSCASKRAQMVESRCSSCIPGG